MYNAVSVCVINWLEPRRHDGNGASWQVLTIIK